MVPFTATMPSDETGDNVGQVISIFPQLNLFASTANSAPLSKKRSCGFIGSYFSVNSPRSIDFAIVLPLAAKGLFAH